MRKSISAAPIHLYGRVLYMYEGPCLQGLLSRRVGGRERQLAAPVPVVRLGHLRRAGEQNTVSTLALIMGGKAVP